MIYMKNIMKEAHKLTREIKREYPEVDYKTQLGICISFLSKNKGVDNMTIEEKLNNLGFKTWEKKDSEGNTTAKRVYVNSLEQLLDALNVNCNVKAYKRDRLVYDVLSDKFSYNVSRSAEETVKEAIKVLRA